MKTLHATCALLGIQTSYVDDRKRHVETPAPVLEKMISLLSGYEPHNEKSYYETFEILKRRRLDKMLAPVFVSWDGRLPVLKLTVPETRLDETFRMTLLGRSHDWDLRKLSPIRVGEHYVFYLPWDKIWTEKIPTGYHEVRCEFGDCLRVSLLIAAPRRLRTDFSEKQWGIFTPLYALRSQGDWGIGSLTELEKTQEFMATKGGQLVGTLPLLAPVGETGTVDPSPYSPSSRLFWNEIYLDVERIAREMGRPVRAGFDAYRKAEYVDHDGVYAAKKAALMELADAFFAGAGPSLPEYERYIREHKDVLAYAKFRSRYAQPQLRELNFHLFVQYQFHRQLLLNRERADRGEIARLYLDFPVGVNPQGYDAKHFQACFIGRASIGAPPDSFFREGQNWGLVPLHPFGVRTDDYGYFRKSLANHLRYASLLRLDHAMSLHRLYVIPEGFGAKEGAYVRFPSEELYAVLCIEAGRYNSEIIGEDLGTVPEVVREKMAEHGLQRMWIFELEYGTDPKKALKSMPQDALVSMNTHDMPPFFKFLTDTHADPEKRKLVDEWLRYLGFDEPAKAEPDAVMERLSARFAGTPARTFLMSLEDLWGETEPQNTPGVVGPTTWRKKNRFAFEEWTKNPELLGLLEKVREERLQ